MPTLALTPDRINAQGGLNLIGKLIDCHSGLRSSFAVDPARRSDRISDADILISELGLLVQGRTHYEDIELFRLPKDHREEEHFARSLGLDRAPGGAILRQRLDELASDPAVAAQLDADNLALIKAYGADALTVQGRRYIPCDIDVSPFDNGGSKREKIGRTYKGCDGFAPIFAYVGTQGWLLHHELRPGVQHCQKNTPEFLRQILERLEILAPSLNDPVLIRMDSGNDSADNLELLRQSPHGFVIKRNQRREDPIKWLSHAMAVGSGVTTRPGKEVYTGSAEHHRPGGENSTQEPMTMVYRVVRRSIDKHGQQLLIDQVSVETYWTNLGEAPEDIIALYHDHGTSEQYHSELKSDLNLERFPSGNFETNTLFLQLGAVAYNLLRALDQLAREVRDHWPPRIKPVRRRRVGSIVRDLILVACKWVRHGGREVMKLSTHWPWSRVMLAIDARLSAA